MSNRQKPRIPWLAKMGRPRSVVYSATHGVTFFHKTSWFEERGVDPCRDECGIESSAKTAHHHGLYADRA